MSAATLCIVGRDSLELHFEGACYGPISHTQTLGTLLFALEPDQVNLAAVAPAFASAMAQVMTAARTTTTALATWAERDDTDCLDEVSPEILATWIHACCQAAPPDHVDMLQARLASRLGASPWDGRTVH